MIFLAIIVKSFLKIKTNCKEYIFIIVNSIYIQFMVQSASPLLKSLYLRYPVQYEQEKLVYIHFKYLLTDLVLPCL